jgi:hypothetical protein
MNRFATQIRDICYGIKIGQRLCVSSRMFYNAFPTSPDWGIYRTSRQAFLSGMMGSAWGCWTLEDMSEVGCVIIGRHKESDKRVYVDPDTEHLFTKMPDGELKLK